MATHTLAQLRRSWRATLEPLQFFSSGQIQRLFGPIRQRVVFRRGRRTEPCIVIHSRIEVLDPFREASAYIRLLETQFSPDGYSFRYHWWTESEVQTAAPLFRAVGLKLFDTFSTVAALLDLFEEADRLRCYPEALLQLKPDAALNQLRRFETMTGKVEAALGLDEGAHSFPHNDLSLSLLYYHGGDLQKAAEYTERWWDFAKTLSRPTPEWRLRNAKQHAALCSGQQRPI